MHWSFHKEINTSNMSEERTYVYGWVSRALEGTVRLHERAFMVESVQSSQPPQQTPETSLEILVFPFS